MLRRLYLYLWRLYLFIHPFPEFRSRRDEAASHPDGAPAGRAVAAAALAAALALDSGAPAGAALDRETFKAGAGATIKYTEMVNDLRAQAEKARTGSSFFICRSL
jgi:hypothetical protein